jgi:hypothetical protein
MVVWWIWNTWNSFYTNSYAIAKQWSELSWLGSTNDAVKARDLQDLANVWKNVKIPETMVSTKTQIWWILDIKA